MPLDIKEGDILVVDGAEYPIRSCGEWDWPYARLGAQRLMTKAATTKRTPAVAGGKRGTPATKLTDIRCMPLDPVSPDLRQRLALDTPHELLQTVVNGGDVFYSLVVEDLKK